MPATDLKILCVHGVGHKEADPGFVGPWRNAIEESLTRWGPGWSPVIDFLAYDDLFEGAELGGATILEAVGRLTGGLIRYGIEDLLGRRSRGWGISQLARWTAGMVAQWTADEGLRAELRRRLREKIRDFDPAVICAHSLGSLFSYDLFAREPESIHGRWFVSLGSQIGNPAVRAVFGGRIKGLAGRKWFHLYNPEDAVFTAPLDVSDEDGEFEQVRTEFDLTGILDHDAAAYLAHPDTGAIVWRTVAGAAAPSRPVTRASAVYVAEPNLKQKALLVGINDYPNLSDRLEGCVNDVYQMSAVLQDRGFPAESIRVVLDDRATAKGILDRLEWLLDGTRDGDVRFFYYSGHGSKIPTYGDTGEVDGRDECLVPHDFDWSRERAVTDDHFYEMYSQLPYDAHFLAVLDCCHSGGMTRDSGVRVRGLSPPDDIRHRELRWNSEAQMWEQRRLAMSDKSLVADPKEMGLFLGRTGSTRRLGRAVRLWGPEEKFEEVKAAYNHKGPYMPILLEACEEEQFSYEYRHGATAYGAFTYCLTKIVLEMRKARKQLTFEEVMNRTRRRLKALRYDQTPTLVGPKGKIDQFVPFLGAAGKGGARKEGRS